MLRVQVGYPSLSEEEAILHRFKNAEPFESLQPVTSAEQVLAYGVSGPIAAFKSACSFGSVTLAKACGTLVR